MTWVHWVLYNLPPDTKRLAEAIESDELPAGTQEGKNDWKRTGYGGPCPPIGRHRYFFCRAGCDVARHESPDEGTTGEGGEGTLEKVGWTIGTYQKTRKEE